MLNPDSNSLYRLISGLVRRGWIDESIYALLASAPHDKVEQMIIRVRSDVEMQAIFAEIKAALKPLHEAREIGRRMVVRQ